MRSRGSASEPMIVKQVFPGWSIAIPAAFHETFVEEDAYWHGYDAHRSVSLTSMLVIDELLGPVSREDLAQAFPPVDGAPMEQLPPGLLGWATRGRAIPPARASRILQGMLASDGRALLATITADDLDWARRTWLSIRNHPVPLSGDSPGTLGPATRTQ